MNETQINALAKCGCNDLDHAAEMLWPCHLEAMPAYEWAAIKGRIWSMREQAGWSPR